MREKIDLVSDFFKRIFVIDAKKRMTFAEIAQHGLLANYKDDCNENVAFYKKIDNDEESFTKKMRDHDDDKKD